MRTLIFAIVLGGMPIAFPTPASAIELERMYEPRSAFAETDRNLDGRIDLKEFIDRIDDVFYAADVDKSGFLSREEFGRLVFPGDFGKIDSNKDGRVTMHEFEIGRVHGFEVADTDKDGELSLEEVVAVYEKGGRK